MKNLIEEVENIVIDDKTRKKLNALIEKRKQLDKDKVSVNILIDDQRTIIFISKKRRDRLIKEYREYWISALGDEETLKRKNSMMLSQYRKD